MKFNGRDISSYWSAKAVKFDTSYYSDFGRQEITFRGLLLSYLEIPTVRKISVDILVKDRDKHLLDKTIRDMADWFYSSGEAKLFNDRNLSQYYMARCIAISVPKFSGHSATFTVDFTCSDYRPYDAITNQPIGDATTALSNFTFNGKHCLNDMNCLFVADGYSVVPKVKRNAYEISGRSGTVRYDGSLAPLEERYCSGMLYFLKSGGSTEMMTPTEILERAHEVASWLVNGKRAMLSFDCDSSRQVEAEFIDTQDISYEKWVNGAIPIKILMQPYFSDKTISSKSGSISMSAGTWVNFDLGTIGSKVGYTTPVVITVQNAGSSAITDLRIGYYDENNVLKEMRISASNFSLGAGQTLTINSPNYDVTIGSTAALKHVNSGDFPVITPNGTKRIRFRSNIATTLAVTVSMNVRWL